MSDISAKLENVAKMDEEWRVQARKASRREERMREAMAESGMTELEKHTELLREIRTILSRLLAIAEYKAPRS